MTRSLGVRRRVATRALAFISPVATLLVASNAMAQEADRPPPWSINLFEEHKDEYIQPDEPKLIDVGPATYLAIEGTGAPESEAFRDAMSALYTVGFTMKFMFMREENVNFNVGISEGLWWADEDKHESFLEAPREEWRWKLLMRVPALVTKEHVKRVIAEAKERDESKPCEQVRLEVIEEGPCAQILHRGPYADEPATIARLHAFIEAQGHEFNGKHHEIYLTAPRMTPPEKMKTILRQPVNKKEAAGHEQ